MITRMVDIIIIETIIATRFRLPPANSVEVRDRGVGVGNNGDDNDDVGGEDVDDEDSKRDDGGGECCLGRDVDGG